MKKSTCAVVLSMLVLTVIGCAKKANDAGTNSSALDISAPPPAEVAYEPPAPQPVAQPVIYDTAPAATPAPATGGGTYVVQKGDTLYGIARQRYGDGKQWQRIAQANPGVAPQSLRVGQTLVIP